MMPEDLNMALGQTINTEGGYSKWRISGGFFRLNYVFNDRYLLEVNGRLDGSSKFPSDSQYAFFPSVSAGWRVFARAVLEGSRGNLLESEGTCLLWFLR